VDRKTLLGWYVHFFGTYEPEVRDGIRRTLPPGGVAFDIGANVGWHTIMMARLCGAEGAVHAFEPNPSTCRRLRETVARNGLANVRVAELALADHAGPSGFTAPPAGDLWDGTGFLAPAGGELPQVLCSTLDGFVQGQNVPRLDLIKIDVEGWEYAVLRGGRRTLAFFRPKIIFEYDPAYALRCGGTEEGIRSLFSALRYELFSLHPRGGVSPVRRLGPRSGNFLALPLAEDGNRQPADLRRRSLGA
jgi:FkbM family methyltransferase